MRPGGVNSFHPIATTFRAKFGTMRTRSLRADAMRSTQ